MRHYVTTAHAPLLPQLRVLHASMQRHCRPFRLHVLAEGREVFEWCLTEPEVAVTLVDALLWNRPNLARDRLPGPPRRACEVAWTRRWWHARDVLEAGGEPVTVLDADLMFFSSPEPAFEEIGGAPFAVLPHAFAPAARGLPGVTLETHRRFGLYNAGFVHFADAASAGEMAELCRQGPMFEDRAFPDGTTRWGEQGALEYLAEARGAHVIAHPGAAPGPWNIHTQELARRADGSLSFGGRDLVAFHYHAFRARPGGFDFSHASYGVTPEQARLLGEPYAAALADAA